MNKCNKTIFQLMNNEKNEIKCKHYCDFELLIQTNFMIIKS